MINRHIFTDKPTRKEKLADYLTALVLIIVGTVGLLAYFDVLTK